MDGFGGNVSKISIMWPLVVFKLLKLIFVSDGQSSSGDKELHWYGFTASSNVWLVKNWGNNVSLHKNSIWISKSLNCNTVVFLLTEAWEGLTLFNICLSMLAVTCHTEVINHFVQRSNISEIVLTVFSIVACMYDIIILINGWISEVVI